MVAEFREAERMWYVTPGFRRAAGLVNNIR